MNHEHELSHRQEREQKKEEHKGSTPAPYLAGKHVTWGLVIGIIVIGAALLVWTFILPAANAPR